MVRRLIALLLLIVLVPLLGGCGRVLTTEQFAVQQQRVDLVVGALRDTGVEAMGFIRLPLNVGLSHTTSLGSDGEIMVLFRVNPGQGAVLKLPDASGGGGVE